MPPTDNRKLPFSVLSEPGLVTDLYELTMAQTYFQHGMSSRATFSLFIRSYPPNRGYFVAAGLGGRAAIPG